MLDDLRVRPVKRRGGLFVEIPLPDVRGHADNLPPDVFHGPGCRATRHRGMLREAHTHSERILVGEVPPRQTLADDDDRSRCPGVFLREYAPLQQRNSHRAKVILTDQDVSGLRLLPGGGPRSTIDGKFLLTRAVHRRPRRHGGEQHARILADSIECRSPEGHRLWKGPACIRNGLEQVLGIDATGRCLQLHEAPDHQPGADQQHERDSQFRDDQQAARPSPAEPGGHARGFQAIVEIDLRRLHSGHETEHDACDQRDKDREH